VVTPVANSGTMIVTPISVSLLEASEIVPLNVNFCCPYDKKDKKNSKRETVLVSPFINKAILYKSNHKYGLEKKLNNKLENKKPS